MSYVDPATQGTPAEGVPISHQWGDDVQADIEYLNSQVGANGTSITANAAAIAAETTRAEAAEAAVAAEIPAPASTVVGPDSFGASSAVGTSTHYARSDHDHGLPAAPSVPGPATTVTGPDAFGASPAVGSGTTYARADHDHGLPAISQVVANLGTDATIPATTITTVLSLTLAVGVYVVAANMSVTASGTVGGDLNLVQGTATATFNGVAELAIDWTTFGFPAPVNLVCICVVTVAGTVLMVVDPSGAATAKAASTETGKPATSMCAFKIG